MTYLISQMWLCLLITAVIAGIIGWLLRGSAKKKLQALDQQWQQEYNVVDSARAKYKSQVKQQSFLKSTNKELEHQVSMQKKSFEETIEKLKEQIDIKDTKQATLLREKEEEYAANLQKLDAKLEAIEEEKVATKTYFEEIIQAEKNKSASLAAELQASKTDLASTKEKLLLVSNALGEEKDQNIKLTNDFSKKDAALKNQLNQVIKEKNKAEQNISNTLHKVKQSVSNNLSKNTDSLDVNDKLNTDDISHKVSDTKDSIQSGFNKIKEDIDSTKIDSAKSDLSSTSEHSESDKLASHKRKDSDSSEAGFFSHMKEKLDDFSSFKSTADVSSHKETQENKISTDIKSMFAATGIAALAKTGVKKARSSFEQAKDTLTDHDDNGDNDELPIAMIQSISNSDAKRLIAMKIETTKDLLSRTSSDTAIDLLAKSLGKEQKVIRQWTNNASLIQVKGVDALLAELIELSGIDSVEALANSNLSQVADGITMVYQTISKRNKLPSKSELQSVINNAKAICRT